MCQLTLGNPHGSLYAFNAKSVALNSTPTITDK